MNQAWLQVAGLVFDILGVGFIAWEWFQAQRGERALRAIEQRRDQAQQSLDRLRATGTADPADLVKLIADSDQRIAHFRQFNARRWYVRRRLTPSMPECCSCWLGSFSNSWALGPAVVPGSASGPQGSP
jgi:hypothetical protein